MVFSSVLSTKPKYNANAHYIMVCSFERPWSKLALAWSHPFQITERTSVERLFELYDKMSSSLSLLDTRIKLTWMQRLFLSWKFSSHIAFLICAVDFFPIVFVCVSCLQVFLNTWWCAISFNFQIQSPPIPLQLT